MKKILQFLSQTHLGTGVKLTLSNICAIISQRQDQAPRLPSRWKCAHRLTSSGGGGTVRIRERRSRDPQSVKVFESIAGRTGCDKVMFADVQTKFAADLPVLVLVKTFWHNCVNALAGCCRWHPGLVAIKLYYRQSSGLFRYPEIRVDTVS